MAKPMAMGGSILLSRQVLVSDDDDAVVVVSTGPAATRENSVANRSRTIIG